MDGSDADVLMRMRDQVDNFEKKIGQDKDDKVNDGNNYKGMMRAEDYKKRREEVLGVRVRGWGKGRRHGRTLPIGDLRAGVVDKII